MFSLSTLILTALVCALGGCVLGALLSRSLQPEKQQNREMEQRLQRAEEKLSDYQTEVSEHFAQTSQLVNNLTQSYKEVHEYLANSALKLTNPDISRKIIEAADGKLLQDSDITITEDNIEAPRDWAPKSPGQTGTLSEEYGLDEERSDLEAITVNRDNALS